MEIDNLTLYNWPSCHLSNLCSTDGLCMPHTSVPLNQRPVRKKINKCKYTPKRKENSLSLKREKWKQIFTVILLDNLQNSNLFPKPIILENYKTQRTKGNFWSYSSYDFQLHNNESK